MNKRMAIIFVVVLTGALVLGGMALAQAGDEPAGPYAVRMAAAAGGGYHLDGGGWQVQGAAGGPGYRLEPPATLGGGTPCCCTYLPCIQRGY